MRRIRLAREIVEHFVTRLEKVEILLGFVARGRIEVGAEHDAIGETLDQFTESAGLATQLSDSSGGIDPEVRGSTENLLHPIEVLGCAPDVDTNVARARSRQHEGLEGVDQSIESGEGGPVADPHSRGFDELIEPLVP